MMLIYKPVTKKSKDFHAIKDLYLSSFPQSERAPFWFLLRRAKKEYINFYAYYDKDEFVGLAYLVSHNKLTQIEYVAVNPDDRSKGYGSQILNHIKENYPNNRIILGIESVDENADNNEQRKKRRNFYVKNGYDASGIIAEQRGDVFELLIQGGNCTIDELWALNKKFVGSLIFLFLKPFFKPKLLKV